MLCDRLQVRLTFGAGFVDIALRMDVIGRQKL